MTKNIVLCGVGGQGTVLASKLIACASMNKGLSVMSAETIGMAQRGGSVFSHVRIGENLYTPMIQTCTADLILGFEPGETVRMLPYLKPDGYVVTNSRAIQPVTATLSSTPYAAEPMLAYLREYTDRLTVVDGAAACESLQNSKVLNMVLLGAAIGTGVLGLDEADICEAITQVLPEKFHEINFRAIHYCA